MFNPRPAVPGKLQTGSKKNDGTIHNVENDFRSSDDTTGVYRPA